MFFPDGKPFGTICVLDRKENFYSDTYAELMLKLRTVIQNQIELNYTNHILGKKNRCLIDYLDEIKVLRGIIPICCCCKKIRDDQGYWEASRILYFKAKRRAIQSWYLPGMCKKALSKQGLGLDN